MQGLSEALARTRTGDPFITSEVLYQLSYVGACRCECTRATVIPTGPIRARRGGRSGPGALATSGLIVSGWGYPHCDSGEPAMVVSYRRRDDLVINHRPKDSS